MKKVLATITLAATIGVAAYAISTVLPAGAQSTPSPSSGATASSSCGRGGVLHDALAGLVQNGTLTQAQADAVVQAVKDEVQTRRQDGAGRHPRARALAGALKVAADTIGVTPADLVQARHDGQSVADVARSKNVDPATVVNAIVAAGNQKIDRLVTDGTITQAQADKAKSRLPDMADRLVNSTAAC